MIKITPTTESGLTHSEYTVFLNGELDVHAPRAKKVSDTLAGIPVTTLWKKTRVGATKSLDVNITKVQYKVLKKLVYHATQFEWLVFADDDRFLCEVDIAASANRSISGNPDYKSVTVSFLIIEEL